ncbi:ABC transporter ATP-binding protein [Streptomyces sp. 6-11-2]|uniref:ABC transporter ATP-binding protein n=1 Tax=unclassified Streptomyces TaxID=2593676 RepID=UPI0011440366|nr:ABC transporter ATP-binding protein [Streptomyces sp. 6-11-2]GED90466.1 ABC transporter ATP-binding protein [Streptomyces sp. 6-11-2]
MLRVNDLTVRYGAVTAVDRVSLEVPEGKVIALVGVNGAGKSSTLAAISGLVKAESGSVELDGEQLSRLPPETVVRRGIALVPEGREIFASLTVEENLHLGTLGRGDRGSAREATEEVLEQFPVLRKYLKSSAGKLSGGEQQQLAIARALLSNPRVLLLDEPSLGLAPQVVDLVFDVIDGLRDRGVTVLLVEQNATRAIELADFTYVLRLGRIADQGSRDAILSRTDLISLYLGG